MAVSFVRTHTVATPIKAAGTTIGANISTATVAGNTLIAYILFDNAATASKPIVSSIAKAAGETANWVLLGAARSTSTTAGAFASGEIWAIKTTVSWPVAAYTVTLDTSTVMKATVVNEFAGLLATVRSTAGTAYSTTTTAASATTTGTAPVIGDLAVGFIFGSNVAAAPAGSTNATGGTWNTFSLPGSTGGNATTNNFGVAQHKYLTAASHQTYANSAAMTAGNGSIVAILQYDSNYVSPKTETLTDDFATDDTTKWPLVNRYNTAVIQNGRVELTELTNPPRYSGILSNTTYGLTNSYVSVKLTPPAVQTASTETTLTVRDAGATNSASFIVYWDPAQVGSEAQVCMRLKVAGATDNGFIAYNATTMAYARIRHASGTYYWDTSPDGITWTNRRSLASAMTLDPCAVELSVGQWATQVTQGTGYFDDLNIAGVAKIATLTDTFDTQIDATKWTTRQGTVAWDTSGRAAITELSASYSILQSVAYYDFTDSAVSVRVYPMPLVSTGRETEIDVFNDDNNRITMVRASTADNLLMRVRTASVNSDTTVPFDSVAHAWWRIRIVGTTNVYFDTSPDGVTWTNRRTTTTTLTLTRTKLELRAGQWQADAGGLQTAYFDYINAVPLPKTETLTDTFNTSLDKITKWPATSVATVWEAGQVKIPLTVQNAYYNLGTLAAGEYDFTGSYVYARITPAMGGSRETFLQIMRGGASGDKLELFCSGTQIGARKWVGGSVTAQATAITYNPTSHAWWRVREASGTTYFDTSPDATTWTNLWSTTNGFAVTDVAVNFISGYYTAGEVAAYSYVDHVNTPVTSGWVNGAGTYTTASGTATVTLPPFVAGDLAVLVVGNDAGTDPNYVTPSGWTYQGKTAATNMYSYIFSRVLQAGDVSVALTMAAGGTVAVGIWRGVTWGSLGTFGVRSGTVFTATAPNHPTATGMRAHIFSDRTTAATAAEADTMPTALTYGAPRFFYAGNPAVSGAVGICAVYFVDSASGSGDNTATLTDSSTNAWGVQLDLGGVAAATGRPKAYVGASFQTKPGKVWTGSAWVEKPWKQWTGSAWKTLP